MAEPNDFVNHPLFIALRESELLEGVDYLQAEMLELARVPVADQPARAVVMMEKLTPLIEGGYLDPDAAFAGMMYAVQLGVEREFYQKERESDVDGQTT